MVGWISEVTRKSQAVCNGRSFVCALSHSTTLAVCVFNHGVVCLIVRRAFDESHRLHNLLVFQFPVPMAPGASVEGASLLVAMDNESTATKYRHPCPVDTTSRHDRTPLASSHKIDSTITWTSYSGSSPCISKIIFHCVFMICHWFTVVRWYSTCLQVLQFCARATRHVGIQKVIVHVRDLK